MNTTTTDSTVQRKLIEILRILHENQKPIGARLIADRMNERGYPIGERGVRYHLRILDERGLTERQGYDGRIITERGAKELENALVGDRTGFIITKIEKLIYDTTFDPRTKEGNVIINTSIIDKKDIDQVMETMEQVINDGYSFSPYLRILEEDTQSFDINIPQGKIGIATMCSITMDGILLKNGIPVSPKCGGLLEIKNRKPKGFEDVIVYTGTSIDPMKIFMSKKMTHVYDAVETGSGRILANLREIPGSAIIDAKKVLTLAMEEGIAGIAEIGETGKSVQNAPVDSGKVGIVIYAGTNIIAAVEEKGIEVKTYPISTIMDFRHLKTLRSN